MIIRFEGSRIVIKENYNDVDYVLTIEPSKPSTFRGISIHLEGNGVEQNNHDEIRNIATELMVQAIHNADIE